MSSSSVGDSTLTGLIWTGGGSAERGKAGSGVGRNVMVRFKAERDEISLTYGRSVFEGRLAERMQVSFCSRLTMIVQFT